MSEVTMTIYEALAKKKILEKQVEKITMKSADLNDIISTNIRNSLFQGKYTADEYNNLMVSRFMSYNHLVKNLNTISAAIAESNARNTITINGHTYSVAFAMSRYNSLDREYSLLQKYEMQYDDAVQYMNHANERNCSDDAINRAIASTIGTKTVSEEAYSSFRDTYIESHEFVLYDPNNIVDFVDKARSELDAFKDQLHFAITKSNVENTITIELED